MQRTEFYAALGRLLYAVSDADGVVNDQERDSLVELIRTRLTHRETHTDSYGTNDAWYTEFGFETAEDQGLEAAEALQSFAEYLEAFRNEIDEETRQRCLLLADRLAMSYRETNRPERRMLQRIREVLFSLENMPDRHKDTGTT